MDPSLIKEREAFLKRAKTISVVEKPRIVSSTTESPSPLVSSKRPPLSSAEIRMFDSRPQSQGKFVILSKIVKYMRALPNNPKIKACPEGKFVFKPRFDIRNRQDLYQLLRRHEMKGLGGIIMDDVAESIQDAEKIIDSFGDHVTRITTPHDKKTILFYSDKSFDLDVDDEFKQQWRGVSVEGVHETKIEEYLKRNGISSMSGERKGFIPARRKKPGVRRLINKPVKMKDNEHVTDIMKDFNPPDAQNTR